MSTLENPGPLKPSDPAELAPAVLATPKNPQILDFLAGLPALLAVFGMLAVLALAMISPPTTAQYSAEAKRRMEKGDIPGALACTRRVLSLNPEDLENRYDMIVLLAKSNDVQKADSLAQAMVAQGAAQFEQRIKEESRYPIAKAHLYLAERYAQDVRNLRQNRDIIENHLSKYIRASRSTNHLREEKNGEGMLGEVYAQTGPLIRAKELLEKSSDNQPMRIFKLGVVCDRLGEPGIAKQHYEEAIKAARIVLEMNPENGLARITLALSLTSLSKYQEALNILNEAYGKTKQEEFRKMMATTCLDWLRHVENLPKAGGDERLAERLKILNEGINYDPTNFDLLAKLSEMMTEPGKGAAEAKKILNKMIVTSQSPGMAHFFLGNDAWLHKKFDVAGTHWEAAFKLEPRMPVVANNLAFLLAFNEPTDEKRALSMVDQALNVPGSAPLLQGQLLGTRGQIFAKMGNYKEALTNLEGALKVDQTIAGIHTSLADTYEHLGMPDLAAEHKKIAGELEKAKALKK